MQLKNHLVDYIKQTFPQGFDLGIYFASHLQEVFHKKVTDDEIAFLAIHLYTALASQHQAVGTKKVLVISSMRQSENILLKQTLLNWFAETTSELTFKTPEQIEDKDIEDYDIFHYNRTQSLLRFRACFLCRSIPRTAGLSKPEACN